MAGRKRKEQISTDDPLVFSFKIVKTQVDGKTKLSDRENESDAKPENIGRIPRISKLMALAIHLQGLVDNGIVNDYADIARLTGITRARVTQIMNLNLLAPQIQEEILLLPRIMDGADTITERKLRQVVANPVWPLDSSKYI